MQETPSVEERLLGGLLVGLVRYPDAVEAALTSLEPQHFTEPANRLVFGAVVALRRAGRPVDLVAVAEGLRRSGEIEEAGGCVRLAELWMWACGPDEVTELARLLTK